MKIKKGKSAVIDSKQKKLILDEAERIEAELQEAQNDLDQLLGDDKVEEIETLLDQVSENISSDTDVIIN